MSDLQLTEVPTVRSGMLIRKSAAEVCNAFVDPVITTHFWFTKSSGKLEAGTSVQWEWEMYGVSVPVAVVAVEPGERIVVEFPGDPDPTTVEWIFEPTDDGNTFVRILHTGFTGDGDSLVKHALESTEGFALVLAGAKAFLEHGISLNLVADRYPQGLGDD